MKILFLLLKSFTILAALSALIITAYVCLHPAFGGKPDAASLARIRASRYYDGTAFHNLEPTRLMTPDGKNHTTLDWLRGYFNPPAGKNPTAPLPSEPLRADTLQDGRLAWFGHSTVLFQMAGKRLITDPRLLPRHTAALRRRTLPADPSDPARRSATARCRAPLA